MIFYTIYILECLKCIKYQTHYTSLKDKKEDFPSKLMFLTLKKDVGDDIEHI